MAQLTVNDLSVAEVDLIILPQSTAGTMSGNFTKLTQSLGVIDALQECELGHVTLVPLPNPGRVKFVALATSVHENTSSYGAIYRIIANLALMLPGEVKSVGLPVLGTGAGHLSGLKVWQLMAKAFQEFLPSIEAQVFTMEKDLYDSAKSLFPALSNQPAIKLALNFMLEEMRDLEWVRDMMQMREFYFELAQHQFNEYLQWHDDRVDFKQLLLDFTGSKTVFSKFIARFEQGSATYRFLEICGKLVSYIDRHAFNKKKWNKYPDKRTMALSNVNQTRWIDNLIRFRARVNDYSVLTPSVRNAFQFLRQPAETLTMLSNNHRAKVAKAFFNGVGPDELLTQLGEYFRQYAIECVNRDNDGHLYTRILYAPEVKALWFSEVHDRETDERLTLEESVVSQDETLETSELVRKRNLQQLMYSDLYASTDLLNYETYASIIARLITTDFCKPPFNVSILAPWGKGKTTLMRFIQKKISTKKVQEKIVKERPVSTLSTLLNWLDNTETLFSSFKKLDHPVIWFNAWKFQKNEQIWAGLADEIIRQLAEQLDSVNREKFWLKLNIKRVDRDKLKRELLFKLVQKCLVPLLYSISGFLLSYWLKSEDISQYLNPGIMLASSFVNAIPVLVGLSLAVKKVIAGYKEPAELEVGKYVLQPEYRQKMGYLQAVEDDLRQAIALVINENKPAVIFIDDLDRCSPNVIGEVVEAINAFMSGDLSNCYFIIGQDPQMVIASLDSAYEKIAGKIGKLENHSNSIGRFFLEKFSQLAINIPVLNDPQRQSFVETLLAGLDSEAIPDEEKQSELLNDYRSLEMELDSLADPEDIFNVRKAELEAQIRLFKPERVAEFQQKILDFAFKSYTLNDNELDNIVADVADYLDSPRTIKRFINLFLFYRFFKFTTAGRQIAEIDEPLLGRWLVIMVRWPMLMQAIQWDTEKCFLSGRNAMERAAHFDQLIAGAADQKAYLNSLTAEKLTEAVWLSDVDLFDICKDVRGQIKMADIVQSGLW
jgi:hypothetical protein